MKKDGFSLIELLVVISILMILLANAVPQFSAMARKYNVERETKELYSNLMYARNRAMNTNRTHFVTVNTNSYTIADDMNNVVLNVSVRYPLSSNIEGGPLQFDGRGLANNAGVISITPDFGAAYNCIDILTTRVIMGTYTSENGGSCVPI